MRISATFCYIDDPFREIKSDILVNVVLYVLCSIFGGQLAVSVNSLKTMDSSHEVDKTKAVTKVGFSMCVVLLLSLITETVFAVPRNAIPTNGLQSEKGRPTSVMPHLVSQTVFLPELKNIQETTERPTTHGRVAREILAPYATDIPTSIRNVKQKLREDKKNNREFTKRMKCKKSRRKHKRHRLARKSCPTQTSYLPKRTAEDMFGQTVDVYPVINIGNLALDQMFYESFCDDVERCSCAGVKNKKFESSCQTSHSYTYARIVKSGEIGWSYIKVRSGCSCVIQEKR